MTQAPTTSGSKLFPSAVFPAKLTTPGVEDKVSPGRQYPDFFDPRQSMARFCKGRWNQQ